MTRAAPGFVAAAAVLGLAATPVPPAPGTTPMVAVVHLHTALADGASSPVDLARAARAAGVDALIVTDHLLERVSYAPWPIGNVLGVALSRPSVLRDGIERYHRALREAETAVPGLVIVPGVEATPYARFRGSVLAGDLTLQGWHRHALVVGIDDPRRLARLPATGNRAGGVFGAWSLVFAAPLAVLAWAIARLLRPRVREIRLAAFRLRRRSVSWTALAAAAAAALCLWAGFPYRVERFSPVGPDAGFEPYRHFARAVAGAGGLMIWAHPEASTTETVRGVRVETAPYPDLVAETGAPLFAALPEGTERLLPPGGVWDRALDAYLRGRRPGPLFALAELDEHAAAADIDFRLLQTVFLVREKSRAGILEALRAGRFYGRWTPRGAEPLRLETWSVERPARAGREAAAAASGGTLAASGPVLIRFAVAGGGPPVDLRIVSGGTPVWTTRGAPPLAASVWAVVEEPTSFRIDVEGPYPYRLVGNPIFVVPREAA
jgi:hypothetical protein